MHELGLAHEILALVQQHVPACDAPAVRTVHVRVGALAGVVVSSLDFCFEAIVTGTPWQRARLVVEHVPACAGCLDCGQVFETGLPGAGCPSCGSGAVRMVSGRELHVDAVELADAPGCDAAAAAEKEAVRV
jgi:hydrogenase nickel incorporation protein HypA/HybF